MYNYHNNNYDIERINTMEKKRFARFGIIPFFSGEWTVVYNNGSLRGYGEFPFDRFPGVPVVNFCGNDAVMDVCRANLTEQASSGKITDKEYFRRLSVMGIEIING